MTNESAERPQLDQLEELKERLGLVPSTRKPVPVEILSMITTWAAVLGRVEVGHILRNGRPVPGSVTPLDYQKAGYEGLLRVMSFTNSRRHFAEFVDFLYSPLPHAPHLSSRHIIGRMESLLIGGCCDPEDVISLLNHPDCPKLELALPLHLLARLLRVPNGVPRFFNVYSGLQLTIFSPPEDAPTRNQDWAVVRRCPEALRRRISRLIFVDEPPPTLLLESFPRLTHVSIPIDTDDEALYKETLNAIPEYLKTIVFVVTGADSFSLPGSTVCGKVYLDYILVRSCKVLCYYGSSSPFFEYWKDTEGVVDDIWLRAEKHTVL